MKSVIAALTAAFMVSPVMATPTTTAEPVVLLHGLARGAASMTTLAKALRAEGYSVCNIAYPSRKYSIATLARDFVRPEIARCFPGQPSRIHFVTHSMGGIIVRQLAASGDMPNIGRVVMLSPPNQGSEIVDTIGRLRLYKALGGPAGEALGTGKNSVAQRLGSATFELGIITGTRSVNPFLSMLLSGENDGKVAVSSARLVGMKDFLAIPSSHPFIMRNPYAIQQTLHFLQHGYFQHALSNV